MGDFTFSRLMTSLTWQLQRSIFSEAIIGEQRANSPGHRSNPIRRKAVLKPKLLSSYEVTLVADLPELKHVIVSRSYCT
jgi:hypothetical protein